MPGNARSYHSTLLIAASLGTIQNLTSVGQQLNISQMLATNTGTDDATESLPALLRQQDSVQISENCLGVPMGCGSTGDSRKILVLWLALCDWQD